MNPNSEDSWIRGGVRRTLYSVFFLATTGFAHLITMTARVLWLKMCFKKGHQSSRTRKNLRIAALANSSKAGEGKKQRLQIVDIKRPTLEWIKVFIRALSLKEQGRQRTKIKKSCSQRKRCRHFGGPNQKHWKGAIWKRRQDLLFRLQKRNL